MIYLLIYHRNQFVKTAEGYHVIQGAPTNLIPCKDAEAYAAALQRLAHTPKGCPVVVMKKSRSGGYVVTHGTVGNLLAG